MVAQGPTEMNELDTNAYDSYTWGITGQADGRLFSPYFAPLLQELDVVTKKEIVKTISEEIGLTQLKTKEIVQKTFNVIVDTLVEDRRIELRNFGVFEVKKRAARKARNPRTGENVDVPEKYVVTFKPGKEMEERVRKLVEESESRKAAAAQAVANSGPLSGTDAGNTPGGSPESMGTAQGLDSNPGL
jgi:nucleoid DNA-binding protein